MANGSLALRQRKLTPLMYVASLWDGVVIECHAEGGADLLFLLVDEVRPFLAVGQQLALGQAGPEQERRAVANQRENLALLIEGRDQDGARRHS